MSKGFSFEPNNAASPPESDGARAERELSAITLPTAILVGAPKPDERKHQTLRHRCKPCRSVVTTRVFTVPSREAAPVHLCPPRRRPSSGQTRLHSRATRTVVYVGKKRARSAHPPSKKNNSADGYTCKFRSQQQGELDGDAPSSPRTLKAPGFVATPPRSVMTAPTARSTEQRMPTSESGGHRRLGSRPYPSPSRRHLHTAPSNSTSRRWGWTPDLKGGCCLTNAEAVRGGERLNRSDFNVVQKPHRMPIARQPRVVMSACARGLAIRRAVDACCEDLPKVPGFSPGAARLLQQWDRATRVQRRELLIALANQLLVRSTESSPPPQQPCRNPKVGLENGSHSEGACGDWIVAQAGSFLEEQAATAHEFQHPSDVDLSTFGNVGPDQDGYYGGSPRTPRCSTTRERAPAHTVRGQKNSNVLRSYPARVQAAVAPREFLALLGAHAGLLATRISSHFQSLHACGHAVGPCLRVIRLLAESKTPAIRSSLRESDDGTDLDSHMLSQQLCTPGVIDAALEVVANPDGVVEVRCSATECVEGGSTPRRYPTMAQGACGPSSSIETGSANQREALRLLLALVHAGGGKVKEYLLCSSFPSSPSYGTKKLAGRVGRGDSGAFGRIVMAIRRPGVGADMRALGGRLLVQLGLYDHQMNNSGSGKVWNAVLCLLGGFADGDCTDGQILGCRVALSLLEGRSLTRCDRRHTARHGNDDESGGTLDGAVPKQQQQQRLMQPELILVPSVLNLSLHHSREVRKAAGQLALLLTIVFPHPCCYLVVAGLVGLFSLVSGVERGASVAWVRLERPSSRCEELGRSRIDAFESLSAPGADNIDSPTFGKAHAGGERERGLRETGRAHCKSGGFVATIEHTDCRQASKFSRVGPEQESESFADSGGAGGESSKASANCGRRGPNRPPAVARTSIAADDDKATFALELLRLVCTGKGDLMDTVTCAALAYALAPLAVLDLVAGSKNPSDDARAAYDAPRKPKSMKARVEGPPDAVFVTQAKVVGEKVGRGHGEDGRGELIEGACPQSEWQLGDGSSPQEGKSGHQAERAPSPAYQDKMSKDPGEDLRPSNHRRSCASTDPSGAVYHAVADALLAMYRVGGGFSHADGEVEAGKTMASSIEQGGGDDISVPPAPNAGDAGHIEKGSEDHMCSGSERLDLKRMINALLDGCPALLLSLQKGDVAAMARVFSSGGGGGECSHTDGGGGVAEVATLRGNILTMTKRLGRVRPPPPPVTPVSASAADQRGVYKRRDSLGARPRDIGDERKGRAARPGGLNAAKISAREQCSGGGESSSVGGRGAKNDEWELEPGRETTTPCVGGISPYRTGSVVADGRPRTARAMTVWDAPRVSHHNLLKRKHLASGNVRSTTAATATPRRQQKQRRRRPNLAVTVTAGKKSATGAMAMCGSGAGPRLWGPEDWGEDAPTMAMLTEPFLRQGQNPEREEGERPGPIWRATFGGEKGPPSTAAEVRTALLAKEASTKGSLCRRESSTSDKRTTAAPIRTNSARKARRGGGAAGGGSLQSGKPVGRPVCGGNDSSPRSPAPPVEPSSMATPEDGALAAAGKGSGRADDRNKCSLGNASEDGVGRERANQICAKGDEKAAPATPPSPVKTRPRSNPRVYRPASTGVPVPTDEHMKTSHGRRKPAKQQALRGRNAILPGTRGRVEGRGGRAGRVQGRAAASTPDESDDYGGIMNAFGLHTRTPPVAVMGPAGSSVRVRVERCNVPVLRTSSVTKGTLEVAERFATTAVGTAVGNRTRRADLDGDGGD